MRPKIIFNPKKTVRRFVLPRKVSPQPHLFLGTKLKRKKERQPAMIPNQLITNQFSRNSARKVI